MSVNEESNQTTSNDEAASNAPAKTSNETNSNSSRQPSRLYARLRPSPSSTPIGTTSTSGSSFGKEEKIVMDNLPVRATAPANLIDDKGSENEELSESTKRNGDAPTRTKKHREGRREREEKRGPVFETHSQEEASTPISQIQEFKPSRDHNRRREHDRLSRPRENSRQKTEKPVGLFAWLKSLFSPETETNEKTRPHGRSSRPNNRNGNRSHQNRRPRGSRGGQNRGHNQRRSRNSNSRSRSSSSR